MTYTSSESVRSRRHDRARRVKGYLSVAVLSLSMLAELFLLLGCKRGQCDPAAVLKTPALYLQHVGDEDKPIEPIVLGIGMPTIPELKCAVPTSLISPYSHAYTVTDEEFSNTVRAIADFEKSKAPLNGHEYRYVLVRGPGAFQIGQLDRDQSKSLFVALEKYFKDRKPEVYTALSDASKLF